MSKNKNITKRSEDYAKWYQDIIEVADLSEHGPSKGSMIIKPYGYAIWENIERLMNERIMATGVKNAYFPMFIPESFLTREKEHVEGFAPELAVVTHGGGEKLEEPLVVRPTSETIIYDAYSRWVESHRDLPILINQWCNVVRWEKRPRLFLRTTEFLWQEGHTAHATKDEAMERTKQMLKVYEDFARECLAIAVVPGQKSESEKFAGAGETFTIEGIMQDGKALQMGTSHFLGQNFAKVFNIKFADESGAEQFVWQTSWGVSTRLIGGLIMSHSDDNGLVLPPVVAPIQVVLVLMMDKDSSAILTKASELKKELGKLGIRVEIDSRDNIRLGAKIFEWEKKGVPVRVEIGPKDLAAGQLVVARRDTGEKIIIKDNELNTVAPKLLKEIQENLLAQSENRVKENTVEVNEWKEFEKLMADSKGFASAHWCGDADCENKIKQETKATIRCLPLGGKEESGKCVKCGKKSSKRALFAIAY